VQKITVIEDIASSLIPKEEKRYLMLFLQDILTVYQCEDLKRYGVVYYLETEQDIQDYSKMGLTQSLKETPFEYCEIVELENRHETVKRLFHACYVVNNDFAIDIFIPDNLLDEETQSQFEENRIEGVLR